MEPKLHTLFKLRTFLSSSQHHLLCLSRKATNGVALCYRTTKIATCSTKCQAEPETPKLQPNFTPSNSVEVLKKWGCSDDDVSKIFTRRPSLREADSVQLQSKLNILSGLGLKSSDLVKIINCRPRFLSSRLNRCFDERFGYFTKFFGSKSVFCKAIVRNPSLLTYDFHQSIKPTIGLYEQMGLSTHDLIPMLISRPTLIPRTSLDDQKIDYIRRTGVPKTAKMYKYVVTLIAISKIETIQEKISNFEKFGFLEDEILRFFGKSPLLLTLSIDKVQRNMTFVVGTLKFPASVVLQYPFLLFFNLESVLKPRHVLAGKIQDMGLSPEIKGQATMLTAIRMTEKRFLKVYVNCHPQEVADQLMEVYRNAKCAKRLAIDSKKIVRKGFPF
ncbi:transcription termination factor MTERF9, chloroplastic-like [Mangifera indica]|uniref:transcription termination factor MTERF9, chloroplastic-like n=1 Tax=Mangifera indica TaxID=29780 RepID=UPI001CFAFA0F|nr:transcription termination factor MTERF9, chloroplastic-like [Mangifera indica]